MALEFHCPVLVWKTKRLPMSSTTLAMKIQGADSPERPINSTSNSRRACDALSWASILISFAGRILKDAQLFAGSCANHIHH